MTTTSVSFDYVSEAIQTHDFKKPLVVGISGVQGSGKSYLTNQLTKELQTEFSELVTILFLMDDLYLTHDEQQKLNAYAKDHNMLLNGRGLPGTHDIKLGMDIFDKLLHGKPVSIPFYDKSKFNGEGDRLEKSLWQEIDSPVNIILFEGWFNGYQLLDPKSFESALSDPRLESFNAEHLREINEKLKDYNPIWDLFDHFIYLRTTDIGNVYKWRAQQEHALIAYTGVGMSNEEVRTFISRYMPIYYLYYERMCNVGLPSAPSFCIDIDADRNVTGSDLRKH